MAMNTKPRLYQRLAFNLIVAVVIGVCFGARQGVAQQSVVGAWSTVNPNPFPFFPVHSHTLPTGKVMIWPGDRAYRATIHDPGIPRIKASAPLHRRATTSFAPATRSWPTEGYSLRVATSKMALD